MICECGTVTIYQEKKDGSRGKDFDGRKMLKYDSLKDERMTLDNLPPTFSSLFFLFFFIFLECVSFLNAARTEEK